MINSIKNTIISVLSILALIATVPMSAQEIAIDPAVRKGELKNGITYYIRHNQEPKERASFYIIQNVGALLENDDQNGLAHFLEHMAFNGTKNFEGKGIINTLQKNGVEFGKNLNAYTSFDETVYNISEVPSTSDELMDTCLLILHDWCDDLLLTEEEVDAERGVITEEWRTRNTAQRRMMTERMSYMMKDSKYTKRDVIGTLDVIQNHDVTTLRDFYHDWYRTDLQAIAIVGDFDAEEMEKKVKLLFSNIPAVKIPKERYYVNVPFNDEPIFGLVTDKEAQGTSVNVTFKHKPVPRENRDINYYKLCITRTLYDQMFRQRINEIMQQENPPFVYGFSTYTEYVNNLDLYYIEAGCRKNEEAIALKAIMAENERVRRFGFTESELERAKLNYLTQFESAYAQRDKISSDQYAEEYARNYLENEPIPGIEKEWEYVQNLLPKITIDKINNIAKEWISYENMVAIVSGSNSENDIHLTETQTFDIIDSVRNSNLKAYVDEDIDSELMTKKPISSKLKHTKKLPTLQAEEWTLENGIKVIYRYSNLDKDLININAQSKGGTSLYDIEDLPSAEMLHCVSTFGLGELNPTNLQKALAGKKVSISANISELYESVTGSASIKDSKTLFQMLNMTFTQPRFDEKLFTSMNKSYSTFLENKKNDPNSKMQDSMILINTNYNPRTLLFNHNYLEQVSFEKIKQIYTERFTNAADFTFYISGNISKEELLPLVETYIGGLDAKNDREDWKNNNIRMPKGITKKKICIPMETPKSTVFIIYGNYDIKYTPKNILYSNLLSDILDLRFTEKVREEAGGTYGVSVSSNMSKFPENKLSLQIQFSCDPLKAEELTKIIYAEIEKIAQNGPLIDDLEKVISVSNKNRESSFQSNNFWNNALRVKYSHNIDIVSSSFHEDIIKKTTTSDIKQFTNEAFKKSNLIEITFYPANK